MKLINLTPHAIHILRADGSALATIAPSGTVARADERTIPLASFEIDGVSAEVPVVSVRYGAAMLPPEYEGVAYIVSAIVAQSPHDRRDLYMPYGMVRDARGVVIGCTGLAASPAQCRPGRPDLN